MIYGMKLEPIIICCNVHGILISFDGECQKCQENARASANTNTASQSKIKSH